MPVWRGHCHLSTQISAAWRPHFLPPDSVPNFVSRECHQTSDSRLCTGEGVIEDYRLSPQIVCGSVPCSAFFPPSGSHVSCILFVSFPRANQSYRFSDQPLGPQTCRSGWAPRPHPSSLCKSSRNLETRLGPFTGLCHPVTTPVALCCHCCSKWLPDLLIPSTRSHAQHSGTRRAQGTYWLGLLAPDLLSARLFLSRPQPAGLRELDLETWPLLWTECLCLSPPKFIR